MGLSQDPCFTPVGVMQEVVEVLQTDLVGSHSLSHSLSLSLQTKQSTIWAVRHLPQNRDVFGTSGGGNLNIWK